MGAHPRDDSQKRMSGREKEAAYRARLKAERPEEYQRHLAESRERAAKWRKENPDKVAEGNKKHRFYKYGLSDVAIAHLYASQDGKCAICQKLIDLDGKWVIDHDHDTGDVRGILCFPCNVALGQFQDSPAMLMRAIEYLERSKVK